MALTSKQRAFLRSKAHGLKPVVHIGAAGVTDATTESLSEALNNRELLKVRIQEGAPGTTREMAEALAAGVQGASVVQTIGRVAVIYRPHPDEPELRLP
jgi:RNA-binding protein